MGGVGGALGSEGTILLQWLQLAWTAVMAGVIPGQNMDDSALAKANSLVFSTLSPK